MAKIIHPFRSDKATGTFAKHLYFCDTATRKYVYTKNGHKINHKATPKQKIVRDSMKEVVALWHDLSKEEKESWDFWFDPRTWVKNQYTWFTGQRGYFLFVACNQELNLAGLPMVRSHTELYGGYDVWKGHSGYFLYLFNDFLYLVQNQEMGRVKKLLPSDLTLKKSFCGTGNQQFFTSITTDGNILFVSSDHYPYYVYYLDPDYFRFFDQFPAPNDFSSPMCLSFIDPYLYVLYYQSPGSLYCFNPSTKEIVSSYTGDWFEDYYTFFIYDSNFFYIISEYSPPILTILNFNDLSLSNYWNNVDYEGPSYCLAQDDSYLYIPLYFDPGRIVLIDKSSQEESESFELPSEYSLNKSICSDQDYLYLTCSSPNNALIQIEKSTHDITNVWTPEGSQVNPRYVCCDDLYLYVTFDCDPVYVSKISKSTFETVKTW